MLKFISLTAKTEEEDAGAIFKRRSFFFFFFPYSRRRRRRCCCPSTRVFCRVWASPRDRLASYCRVLYTRVKWQGRAPYGRKAPTIFCHYFLIREWFGAEREKGRMLRKSQGNPWFMVIPSLVLWRLSGVVHSKPSLHLLIIVHLRLCCKASRMYIHQPIASFSSLFFFYFSVKKSS